MIGAAYALVFHAQIKGLVRDFRLRGDWLQRQFRSLQLFVVRIFCTYPLLLSTSLALEGVKRRNSGSRQRVEEYFTEASEENMRFEADGSY